MNVRLALGLCTVILCLCGASAKLNGDDCEVCIGFLNKFGRRLKEREVAVYDQSKTELELMKACVDAKGKEERFCYYIGAAKTSATRLINEVLKPLSFSKPVDKICEALKKKDAQICELRYEKKIDVNAVDLKKLRVKELKKILSAWDEDCRGCAEKNDFVRKINDVKHLHMEL